MPSRASLVAGWRPLGPGLNRRAAGCTQGPDHLHAPVAALGHPRRFSGLFPALAGRSASRGSDFWTLGRELRRWRFGRSTFKHLDPPGPQVAGEPCPVGAGTLYPGASHGAEALRPDTEPLVTLCGRWHAGLTQASLPRWSTAIATWKSRWVSTPRITATSASCLSAPIVLTFQTPFDVALTSTRGAGENGRMCCEGSRQRRAPMRSRRCSGLGRHQLLRPRRHSEGTFGSRGRRVRPLRGVAHSHSPGYSQRGRFILRSSAAKQRQDAHCWGCAKP